MKTQYSKQLTCLLLGVFFLPIANAEVPCNIWKGAWGLWHSDCDLEDFNPGPAPMRLQSGPQVQLPNLRANKSSYDIFHNTVDVYAKFENDGLKDVEASFGLEATVSLYELDTPLDRPLSSVPVSLTIDGLAADQQTERYLATISHTPPFYVGTSFHVDPVSYRSPGGTIWESNETDNHYFHLCGYYPAGYTPAIGQPEPCH